jgi:hypothetical protein
MNFDPWMEKVRRKTRRVWKPMYQRFRGSARPEDPRVLLILGCQRSGTTLMLDVLDRDRRTVTYPEESVLTSNADKLRLLPLSLVNDYIARLHVPLVVLKPLVESQRAPELLTNLRRARALWMYRRYNSVAVSNLKHFGQDNGARDLHLLLTNTPPNWRGEVVPAGTREVIESLSSLDMRTHDAAALFWWARNMLFFELGLHNRDDVLLVSYEDLITNPSTVMRGVYDFMDFSFPQWNITQEIKPNALKRGQDAALSREVEQLCEALYDRLNHHSSERASDKI